MLPLVSLSVSSPGRNVLQASKIFRLKTGVYLSVGDYGVWGNCCVDCWGCVHCCSSYLCRPHYLLRGPHMLRLGLEARRQRAAAIDIRSPTIYLVAIPRNKSKGINFPVHISSYELFAPLILTIVSFMVSALTFAYT